ncbi:ABC transporter ATP-binding protein, partial [Streptomyces albidoflavus]
GRAPAPCGGAGPTAAPTLAGAAPGAAGRPDAPRVIVPQLQPSPGLPPRQAVARRRERVLSLLGTLPPAARTAIRDTYAKDAAAPTLTVPRAGSGS